MSHFSIEPNTNILLKGRRFRLGNLLPENEIELNPIDGGSFIILKTAELQQAYVKGELEFLDKPWVALASEEMPVTALPEDLSLLPEKIRNEIQRRKAYVDERFKHTEIAWNNKKKLNELIQSIAEKIGDKKPPKSTTLWRWCDAFKKSDGQLLSLMSSAKNRGPKQRYISTEVMNVINAMIDKYYMTKERKSGKSVYELFINEINLINKSKSNGSKLYTPCLNTFYNIIETLDPYEKKRARYGKLAADRQFHQAGKGVLSSRPLERAEIDHSKADLFVIDEVNKLPLGRPWITVAIDHYSRVILGIHIGFTPPSYLTVMKCLKHALLPKSNLHDEFPEIENDWNAFGLMELLVCDNGKEFLSQSFELSLQQLGVDLAYCPVLKPWFKGIIERQLGQINRDFLQGIQGTTFSNFIEKDDYKSDKNAIITLNQLRTLLFKWICDVYHVNHHRGLNGIPIKTFERGIKAFPATLPRNVKEIDVLMGRKENRTIQHYGVQLDNLFYNSDALSPLRHRLNGNKTLVRIDEENLGHLYVYDELARRYIDVPCTEPEYAEGLSLWQHSVIRRFVKKQNQDDSDIETVARAKADIQAMIDDFSNHRRRKTGTAVNAARWTDSNIATNLSNNSINLDHNLLESQDNDTPSFQSFDLPEVNLITNSQAHSSGWAVEPSSH